MRRDRRNLSSRFREKARPGRKLLTRRRAVSIMYVLNQIFVTFERFPDLLIVSSSCSVMSITLIPRQEKTWKLGENGTLFVTISSTPVTK